MKTLDDYLKSNRLKRSSMSAEMIRKELRVGMDDMAEAEHGLDRGAYKWATIQAYYAVFHAMRSLLYLAGFREESHVALKVAIRELYFEQGKISDDAFRAFERGMELREMADYKATFSEETARWLVDKGRICLTEVEKVINPVDATSLIAPKDEI